MSCSNRINAKKKTFIKRLLAIAVAAVVFTVTLPMSAFAQTEAELRQELNELKNKQSQIDKEIGALDGSIDQQEALYDQYTNVLQNINQQIAVYAEQIDALQVQIDTKNSEITTKNEEIAQKQIEYEETREKFKNRLNAMYKASSSESTLNILLGASSFADFLLQAQALKNISDNDKDLMDQLTTQRVELERLRTELETAKAELQTQQDDVAALKAEQDVKAAEQEGLRSQANALREELLAQKGNLEEDAANAAASEADIQKLIAEAEAKRLEASNSGGSGGGGNITGGDTGGNVSNYGWKWPVPQYSFLSQGYKGSAHWGIDIAAPAGTAIIAAQSGTVVFAGETAYGGGFGGYGLCVLLSHGNGLYTLYGHASVLNVSTGQSVSQGQTIAGVGNTGASFGNHLHFEVRNGAQGARLNPMNYVSQPR